VSVTDFLARRERFASVPSTNDVVGAWLADGTPEVCLAVSDEQTAGRGRDGRCWVGPAGSVLLLSVGFRPRWLAPDQVWRLAAVVSLAMAESAEATAGLAAGTVGLKWPNDLVIATGAGDAFLKVAGILGETGGLATADPRVVVGLGINTGWAAADFPPDLAPTMTSLREAATGRSIDDEALLDGFVSRLGARVQELRAGQFDATGWAGRQVTTGRAIRLQTADGVTTARATGVDPVSGALLVEDPGAANDERGVVVGEVIHVRLADPIAGSV
jgi:BirA family biotin operon repressor/biotin-[acetyl-CoA-carboxylase] ligase